MVINSNYKKVLCNIETYSSFDEEFSGGFNVFLLDKVVLIFFLK